MQSSLINRQSRIASSKQSLSFPITHPGAKVPIRSYSRKTVMSSAQLGTPIRSWHEAGQRFLAAVPYFLPFADGLRYGRYLFSSYPALKDVFRPVLPLVYDFQDASYGSLLAFFAILLGIACNSRMTRFARINAMQALVLEVIVVVPNLLGQVFNMSFGGALYEYTCSALWLFVATCVVCAVFSALVGSWVRLPFVTQAAEEQIS